MRIVGVATLALLSAHAATAKESVEGMAINSPKDALLLVSTDSFGPVSLAALAKDINGNVVYRGRAKYSTGEVTIQSQNDVGHYGEVGFEFKPPHNLSKEDVIAQGRKIKDAKVSERDTRVYLRWQSGIFSCMLDFDADPKFPLFQYICHYAGK
ncbi:hypothetical protein [Roseateles asaccharophilus]|uniref:Uncharacterized protein n=1 Tax=Roseateles asaccharophilus TaxID=582607 RepID=A0ABU2AF40_9BURK|nr:hypothetical protein [Roseateles asaccharophilus]MDR7335828.1 hypothetical protein [Roseateles asaccharophilus]